MRRRPIVLRCAHRLRDALASWGFRRPRLLRGARLPWPIDAPRIRTARLELRPHRVADAGDWFALQSHDSVTMFLPWPRRSRRQSARHLADRTRHTRLWQTDDFMALAIVRDGRLIGDISAHLRTVDAANRSLEIGWVIHPDFSGSGYATEAAEALLDFAFEKVGARFVTAVTDSRNVRSTALARRLGFVELRRDERDLVLAIGAETHRERSADCRAARPIARA
jgi:RimJ/RimL family protein N-acetyltransferase